MLGRGLYFNRAEASKVIVDGESRDAREFNDTAKPRYFLTYPVDVDTEDRHRTKHMADFSALIQISVTRAAISRRSLQQVDLSGYAKC